MLREAVAGYSQKCKKVHLSANLPCSADESTAREVTAEVEISLIRLANFWGIAYEKQIDDMLPYFDRKLGQAHSQEAFRLSGDR